MCLRSSWGPVGSEMGWMQPWSTQVQISCPPTELQARCQHQLPITPCLDLDYADAHGKLATEAPCSFAKATIFMVFPFPPNRVISSYLSIKKNKALTFQGHSSLAP